MAPWAVCCRTLEQHQEMHFPQSGVMHFSFAEDLHLCILLPPGEPPSPPPPCTTREGGREKKGRLGEGAGGFFASGSVLAIAVSCPLEILCF